jgi:hypothetical protein
MPATSRLRPGYVVSYPNRDKRSSRTTRAAVIATLLVSVGLIATVTVGGWSELAGLKAVNFAWCAAYLVIAFYVHRWARGPLPIAAALGSLMLAISLIAGTGATGTSWFDRSQPGYATASSLFGGIGLSANLLGVLTLLVAPLQLLLIVLAAQGFREAWNVELEVPANDGPLPDTSPAADAPVASSA